MTFDAVIIGCGIAGASLAYFLAERGMTDVLILEREEQPGYHSTGRAAAVAVEFDFVSSTLDLKIMGARFLRNPPENFSEQPLLEPTGIIMMFGKPMWDQVLKLIPVLRDKGVRVNHIDKAEIISKVPGLAPDNFDGALYLPEDGKMDVHELLWSYLRRARDKGVRLRCGEEVKEVLIEKGVCRGVATEKDEYKSRLVINASGAWAENIRGLAGPSPISLTPYRRTIVTFSAPRDLDVRAWPMIADLDHEIYFSPESTDLMASPMDKDPMEACDARPDELTVAKTIAKLEQVAPSLVPKSLGRKWAGLRTFAPDKVMVVGEDPIVKGFFWLSGQGGAGIESSPAVGRIASDLILDGQSKLMDTQALSPMRFI